MQLPNWCLAPCLFALTSLLSAQTPFTYYVSNQGDDNASGTNPAAAWRTLAKVTQHDLTVGFAPGATILLARGSLFDESQQLDLKSDGTANARLTLGEYGTANLPPIISRRGSGGAGICLKVTGQHWVIRDIRFQEAHRGIVFSAGHTFPNAGCEVSNASFHNIDNRTSSFDLSEGIRFEGWGFDGVRIRHCVFDRVGLGVHTWVGNTVANMHIDQCEAFGGWAAGFALQNVVDSRITNSSVRDVGGLTGPGSTACFLVSCSNVAIDRCSFSGCKHGGGPDGCGIDFESNNYKCELTNCLVYDNDGPAVLMLSGGGVPNTDIKIENCLFYNNNRVLHNYSNPPYPDADSVMHLAALTGQPVSTGTITNCGVYKNSLSTSYFGGDWSGFATTNLVTATQCDGWVPVHGRMRHIAVGSLSHICAVGYDNQVYRWNGSETGNPWILVPGLTQVATVGIGNDGELWATDSSFNAYRHDGASWSLRASNVSKVAVGSAASIWTIFAPGGTPGPVHQLVGAFWVQRATSMTDVDAGPDFKDAWGINGTTVLKYGSSGWQTVAGVLLQQISAHNQEIAAGVYNGVIARTVNGQKFWRQPGTLATVSEGSDGTLWGLDANGYIWRAR